MIVRETANNFARKRSIAEDNGDEVDEDDDDEEEEEGEEDEDEDKDEDDGNGVAALSLLSE